MNRNNGGMKKPVKATREKPTSTQVERPLTPKQKRFVEEYLIDLNATAAYRRAGYAGQGNAGEVAAHTLLRNVKVAAAIAKAQNVRSERTEITQDMVLRKWWEIANANPNDLMQYRRVCCRHCHGTDHAFQWINETEYQEACVQERQQAKKDKRAPRLPSNAGGFGFTTANRPHPKCPNCFGDGRGHVHFNDTRDLTGPAALLYAGAKVSKDGIEVKTHDQGKALENVARHLGMFKEDINITGQIEIAAAIVAARKRSGG